MASLIQRSRRVGSSARLSLSTLDDSSSVRPILHPGPHPLPVKPKKAHGQLSQVVAGMTDRQFACSPQGICGLFS